MTQSAQKRALLIGIDDYQAQKNLEGCANDVQVMGALLQEMYGFPEANITLLTDADANRSNIIAAFEKLIEDTGTDDIVVTHYAGHGSQMTDLEGDEPDGRDETVVTHESHHKGDKPNTDVTDDEIHDWLVSLSEKTLHITMIFDCCHSGTMTRDASGQQARSVEGDTRSGPEMGREPFVPKNPASRAAGGERGASGWLPLSSKYVLIAGCRDDELSYEKVVKHGDTKTIHGSLTYHLCEELRKATSGTTYRDVFEAAAAKVTAHNGRQHPCIEGTLDKEVFGIDTIEPMQFIRVTGREGDTITLAGGTIHGITVGSTWAVYAPSTKAVTEDAAKLGTVEIISVSSGTAQAKLVEESDPADNAIAEGSRAVVEEYAPGSLTLTYDLVVDPELAETAADQADGLRETLGKEDLLVEAEGGAIADARIYLIAPRQDAEPDDPAPQLGGLDETTWAVVTGDGELMMSPKSLDQWQWKDESGQEGGIAANLRVLARHRHAMELDNPDAASRLHGKVKLELHRRDASGQWVAAEPDDEGRFIYEAGYYDSDGDVQGDLVGWRVSLDEGYPEKVFLSLIALDPAGEINVVFPPGEAKEKLAPGTTVDIGMDDNRPEEQWLFTIPADYPFYRDPIDPTPHRAPQDFKLIVSTVPLDMRFIEQAGVAAPVSRSAGGEASPLQSLFEDALGRGPTATRGGMTKAQPVAKRDQDWATVTRTITLKPHSSAGDVALRPDGNEVHLGEVEITTPEIGGTARLRRPEAGSRGTTPEARPSAMAAALWASGMESRCAVALEAEAVAEPTRGASDAGSTISVPDPGPDKGQVILVEDEAGRMRWQYEALDERGAATRGTRDAAGGRRTYALDDRTFLDGETSAEATRGVGGAVVKKLLDVVVFPLIEPAIGEVGDYFAGKWEAKNRPYRIRSFSPDDYNQADGSAITADAWDNLAAGRSLLMVHGTFSRAHTAFGSMPREYVEELHRKYDGRVFAFDHFTISEDPRQNIAWLLDTIRGQTERNLEVDIICHSRGGLVSRLLAEQQGDSGVDVNRIVFAGSPNGGTALASAEHMREFIDRYTNVLSLLGNLDQSGTVETLETVFTVVKQLAVGAFAGLEGIQAMAPGGEWIQKLNEGGATRARYFALASDFTADQSGVAKFFMDQVADRIFGKTENDLVVPTASVFDRRVGLEGGPPGEERRSENGETAGTSPFPIESRLVFEDTDAIAHSGYFGKPGCEKILEWLSE